MTERMLSLRTLLAVTLIEVADLRASGSHDVARTWSNKADGIAREILRLKREKGQ